MLRLPVSVVPFSGEMPDDQEVVTIPIRYWHNGQEYVAYALSDRLSKVLAAIRIKCGEDLVFEISNNGSVNDAMRRYRKSYAWLT